MGVDSHIDISFIIWHMGYYGYIKKQACVLQGSISLVKKYHQMKDEKWGDILQTNQQRIKTNKNQTGEVKYLGVKLHYMLSKSYSFHFELYKDHSSPWNKIYLSFPLVCL